jgi:Protein of unknown function (DUF2723)
MPRYYTPLDWTLAVIAFAIMFSVYFFTLAPTVTLEYSGALAVAADHQGVSKPPGFPVWHMIALGFTRVFSFVTYRGHPNPVWALNVMSAFFGALACGTVTLLVSRISRNFFRTDYQPSIRPVTIAASISASTIFGFSPVMWSQSVVAETHTLTNFYLAAFLAFLLQWTATQKKNHDLAVAFMFGLAFTVSQLLWLIAPVILLAAVMINRTLALQLLAAMLMFFASFCAIMSADSFAEAGIYLAVWVMIAMALFVPPITRRAAAQHLLMWVGMLPYAYVPVAASFSPPVNMGFGRTWEGFRHVVGRGQYERINPMNLFTDPDRFVREFVWIMQLTADQYMLPLAALGLVSLLLWPTIKSTRKEMALVTGTLLCFAVFTVVGLNAVPHDIQTTMLVTRNYIPVYMIWAMMTGCGFVLLHDLAGRRAIWKKSHPACE